VRRWNRYTDEVDGVTSADEIEVRRGGDFAAAFALAEAAGLEVSADAAEPLVLWSAWDGELAAGVVTLDEDAGLLVVGWIAVAEPYRGRGLGERLLFTAEQEARERGVGTLWATARAPGFFLARGYELATAGEEPEALLAGCRDCPQRGVTCRPQAVRKQLDPRAD
jgi:N-acetylglutamate synthase-like GNAT family acetyltransferase